MTWLDLIWNHTAQTVAAGAAALGLVSGGLGAFAVLRRQSLIGDAISHAALPGIAIAFLLTGSKDPLVLVGGAAVAGLAGMLLAIGVVNTTRIKDDSALGIVLSVFFGLGLVLLTLIQKRPDAAQAGLDKFLFGQASALLRKDVAALGIIAIIILTLVGIYWKQFKLLAFDRDFGASLGFSMRAYEILLTGLLTVAIVVGLQTVGVVLMSAMVVAPAAAARQWTSRLGWMVLLSALFGAFSGTAGALISSSLDRMPTGPTIVLCLSAVVLLSLALAPGRGMVWAMARRRTNRARLRIAGVLVDLYELEQQHAPGTPHGHSIGAIQAMSFGEGRIKSSLENLSDQRYAYQVAPGRWALTPEGMDEAHRLSAENGQDAE